MAWVTIPDGDIDPESPIDAPLMAALRDNPIAIAQGLTGAPKVQNAALAGLPWTSAQLGSNSVNAAQISGGAVGNSEMANNAVHRAELYTSTVSLSGNLAASSQVGITLNAYPFFPMIHSTNTGGIISVIPHTTDGASPDNPRFMLDNQSPDTSETYDVDYRYILS